MRCDMQFTFSPSISESQATNCDVFLDERRKYMENACRNPIAPIVRLTNSEKKYTKQAERKHIYRNSKNSLKLIRISENVPQ